MMINLLEETRDALKKHGIEWEDVVWVGGNDFEIPFRDFIKLAYQTDYDNGFGRQYVASDLTIITSLGRFVRKEYDGSEGWEFIKSQMPYHKYFDVNSLVSEKGWQTLAEIYKETHTNGQLFCLGICRNLFSTCRNSIK